MVGLEAMLRLFPEKKANEQAFIALTRFLDALDDVRVTARDARRRSTLVVLSFQLELLWVSGYLPHLETCVECGSADPLVAFLAAAGGGACAACDPGGIGLSPEGRHGIRVLLRAPIADATALALGERAERGASSLSWRRRTSVRRVPAQDADRLARPGSASSNGLGTPPWSITRAAERRVA